MRVTFTKFDGERGTVRITRQYDPTLAAVTGWRLNRLHLAIGADTLARAVARVDAVARQWQKVAYRGSLESAWPRRLSFDPAKSHLGRRRPRTVRRIRG